MENNESLFNEIKSAAENAETKDFPGMEKIWNRVEEKLDNKQDKKAVWRWKKIAVAASLLLFATLGYQFFKSSPDPIKIDTAITTNDSVQKAKPEAVAASDAKADVNANPAIKRNADEILKNQIKPAAQVAMEEKKDEDKNVSIGSLSVSPNQMGYYSAPVTPEKETWAREDYKFKSKKEKSNDIEVFMDKSGQVSNQKQEEPLVVIDNKAERKSIKDIEFNDIDSLVVLKEPLYIINGVEYSEKEVFGPNPTSPYTPLNKQEIETISILQDQKAIEIYGQKGSKGVVIITTKNGKPTTTAKKAK